MVFGIGIILFGSSLKNIEVNAVRSGGFSLFFALVITACLLYIVHRKWTQNFITYFRALNWFQYLVIILIIWSGILLIGIITVMPEYIEDQTESGMLFGLTIIFMGTALVGVVLLVFNAYRKDYYLKQNNIKEEIIHVQQRYFQSIYDNDREMRRFRHDIYSQLRCLGQMLAEGKTEDAWEHLQILGNHFEELTIPKYHTGNEILDVIINQKIQEAKKKGIRIELEGKMDKPDFMDTYDLCTLFSNILDNSIEALETMQDYKEAITVSILTHKNTVLFQFTNPATAEMYEAIRHSRTTKTDSKSHGFGMENIRRVVNKNGGEIDYLFKDGTLIVEIYFEI
ncbi:MAG: GHKL domain-containing protein [Lachnospiraceae bacterium]|nr:GHKL domain-containing protein [Lachnospiraceae bacterium]